jgi:Ca2+-transporting ATPase
VTCENGGAVSFEDDEALEKLMLVCALCNETRITGRDENADPELSGSPTEGALLRLALRSGFDVQQLRKAHPMVGINRRSERRLYMSTRHQRPDGGRFVAVKGSPPEVLSLCDRQFKAGEIVALTDDDRRAVEIRNEAMADDALRVLGFACADLPVGAKKEDENGLVWLGLVGMSDPIRDGVADLIREFHRAGIETVMITGDQSTTAYAVARQLDLSRGGSLDILDSTELQQVDDQTMTALAKRVKVYSRVSPADKLKIVQALQSAGRTVAMTGDGINDGPALKAADIGIAMGGSGTDVAREVADIVLEEDNLETLITAVQDGRSTYRNIRKSVHFFLSTNISEIVVMFAALSAGFGSPLNVMQLLWINIISDIFPGIALSMEEPEPDVLADPPRPPDAPLFTAKDYRRMVQESLMISGGAMGAYIYGISRYGGGAKAGTMAFQSLTFAQLLHALSCRSETHRLFGKIRLPSNNYLNLAVGGSLIMQLLTIFVPPLRSILGLSPLSFADISIAGGSAFVSLMLNEASKP